MHYTGYVRVQVVPLYETLPSLQPWKVRKNLSLLPKLINL